MATIDTVRVYAEDETKAKILLIKINNAVAKGEWQTWEVDQKIAEKPFFHIGDSKQWASEARLYPPKEPDGDKKNRLTFTLKLQQGATKPSQYIRGIYLGRFSEMLIVHFENQLKHITLI